MEPTKLPPRRPRHLSPEMSTRDSMPMLQFSNQRPTRKSTIPPPSAVSATDTLHSNGSQSSNAAKTEDDTQSLPRSTPATPALRPGDKDLNKPASRASESTPSQHDKGNATSARNTPGPSGQTSVPPRPDNRNTPTHPLPQGGRPSHNLPIRPDSQPPRPRQDGRLGGDRQSEYGSHGRHDTRPPPSDYGRLDRPNDPMRDRERPMHGGRTPERMPGPVDRREWQNREQWEYDERAMRGPPRDNRPSAGRPPTWDPRDSRDGRDHRERIDPRGHALPPTMEPRRVPSSSALGQDHPPYRRDMPPGGNYQNAERNDNAPFRQPPAVISANDVPINPSRGALINPARAALIIDSEGRSEPPRPDRDNRRERGPQPQSPRRVEDRRPDERRDDRRGEERIPGMHHGPREHRDERVPPHAYSSNRDIVEDPAAGAPTGPRGGRNDASSSRISREMFQPSQAPRSSGNSAQDPNYGRLNQPSEPVPSGPRSESNVPQFESRPLINKDDRREPQLQQQTPAAPSGPPGSTPAGIHPSRLEMFGGNSRSGPPTPTNNMSNAPSGPRGSGRTPQGPPPMPMNRGPPTGPSVNDRGSRNSDNRHPSLRTINNVLTQNAPTPDRLTDQSASAQSPTVPVRGRGANRANGPTDRQGDMGGPMPPPSHTSIPNMRSESQYSRGDRTGPPSTRSETEPQDERSESHSRRESRRGERSGHDRSHSSSRSEKRSDERSSRTHAGPPTERAGQLEEQERGTERERGRDKRGSEREGSRHHRERGSERSHRDPERSNHESRESKRERGSRDDGRPSGREERDRRSRGGGSGGGNGGNGSGSGSVAGGGGSGGGDDGRKRVRDPADQAHGDVKRRR
jgi:THO complex subunit 2